LSSVELLIRELCPEGVRYISVGEVAEVGTGKSDRNHETLHGEHPLYVRSREILRTDTFEFDETAIVIPGEGGVGEIFHFVEGKYALHQRAYRISFKSPSVDAKFVFYYFEQHFKRYIGLKSLSATVTSIRKPMISDFSIPLPPLQVQEEIVRVLDTFKNLESELEAELEARKKQAFVYRQSILNFDAHKEVVWAQLGSVCRTYSGDFVKKTKQDDNFQFPVFNGGSSFTGFYSESNSPANSITISARGSIGSVNWVDVPFWAGNSCHVISPDSAKLVSRYLYHYLKHNETALQKLKAVGTIPALNLKPLLGFEIPIPSLEAQAQIVKKLDMFDALINDLSFGIPAELAARRKQYEYYRDQLLTFKEA
jgi:type I restriction enzyme S subunit